MQLRVCRHRPTLLLLHHQGTLKKYTRYIYTLPLCNHQPVNSKCMIHAITTFTTFAWLLECGGDDTTMDTLVYMRFCNEWMHPPS